MSSPTARAQRVLSYLAEVRPGAVLSGRYRIERELGAGGMGAVHVARHLELGTKLAVKVLLPELLDDAQAISRFAREARAAAQIQPPTRAASFIVISSLRIYFSSHGPGPSRSSRCSTSAFRKSSPTTMHKAA